MQVERKFEGRNFSSNFGIDSRKLLSFTHPSASELQALPIVLGLFLCVCVCVFGHYLPDLDDVTGMNYGHCLVTRPLSVTCTRGGTSAKILMAGEGGGGCPKVELNTKPKKKYRF